MFDFKIEVHQSSSVKRSVVLVILPFVPLMIEQVTCCRAAELSHQYHENSNIQYYCEQQYFRILVPCYMIVRLYGLKC